MFFMERILAGVCELFTGPEKLTCWAIQLASSNRGSSLGARHPCCLVHVSHGRLFLIELKFAACVFVLCKNIHETPPE